MTGRLRPLTERDYEVLASLRPAYSDERPRWLTPLDIGGGTRSHHSATLHKLIRRELVECKQRHCPEGVTTPQERWSSRGSKEYRITLKGVMMVRERFGPLETQAEFLERMRQLRDVRGERTRHVQGR